MAQLELADCAKRMAQRMDGAESLRKRYAAFEAAIIISVRASMSRPWPAPDDATCAPRPVEPNRLGRHNVARREQGLDVVEHRIERGAAVSAPVAEASTQGGSDPIADEVAADELELGAVRQGQLRGAPTSSAPAAVWMATTGDSAERMHAGTLSETHCSSTLDRNRSSGLSFARYETNQTREFFALASLLQPRPRNFDRGPIREMSGRTPPVRVHPLSLALTI